MEPVPASIWLPDKVRCITKFDRYTTLQENWQFSIRFISKLRAMLRDALSDNVETVALAGSFGRMEGSTSSDADYVMVVSDDRDKRLKSDVEAVSEAIKSLGISPPNKSGVFAAPRTAKQLIDTVGQPDEETDELGKRMLLLLESRPVFGDAAFLALLDRVFSRYAEFLSSDSEKEFAFLLNDLIRYFRYICVNYQANFWRENEKWPIRNLKLRHSRILMYAGLLLLIGEASKHRDSLKVSTVKENLHLTPLERVAYVYEQNNDRGFFRVVGLYNVFLSRLSNPEWRRRLNAVDYDDRYRVPDFAEMKANSDAFAAELSRFVLSRQGVWSDRFFEYLLF